MTRYDTHMPEKIEAAIHANQNLLILRNATQSAIGNILVALVFTLFYSHYISSMAWQWLIFWMGALIIVSLMRIWSSQQILSNFQLNSDSNWPISDDENHDPHLLGLDHNAFQKEATKHYVWVFATGVLWGLACLIFFTEQQIAQTVMMVTIAGIAAGSLSSLSPIKELFFVFLALIFIPLEFKLFFSTGEQSIAFAVLLLFYAVFIAKSGLQNASLFHNTLSANLANQNLIIELTEAKEKAEEAITVKSNFLANISHELRTPLNAILGFISILKQKEDDPQKLHYQEVIDESGHHLLAIINDILDLSRIENHQIETHQETCHLDTEIDKVIQRHSKQAQQKNITISLQKNSPIPPTLELDIQHWKQILTHLVSNAIKFSREKTTTRIELEYIPRSQTLVTHVIDQGIGISKEQQKKILDSFTQADSSSTRQYGGLGLGLTISNHLTQMLGGTFKLESQVGHGSRFSFDVRAIAIADKSPPKPKTPISDQIHGHILIVEDNLTNQLLMKSLIGKLGLSFDIANDGVEAVECFNEKTYDAILMDENMPRLSGTGATLQIRQIEAQKFLPRTPIIAVTANASETDRKRFLEADMDDFIAKPINIPKLIQSLQRFLLAGNKTRD